MSSRASSWALDKAPVTDKAAKMVLIYMADYCAGDGARSWQSVATLSKRTGYGRTAVKNALRVLRDSGLIRVSDDQSDVDKYDEGHRPVVYDLCLDVTWDTVRKDQKPTGSESDPHKTDAVSDTRGRNTTPTGSGNDRGRNANRVRKSAFRGSESGPNIKPKYKTNKTPIAPTGAKAGKSSDNQPRILLPSDWTPNADARVLASRLRLDLDTEARKFRLWAESGSKRLVDWDKRFELWLINAAERLQGKPAANEHTADGQWPNQPEHKPQYGVKSPHVLALLGMTEAEAMESADAWTLARILNKGKTDTAALAELQELKHGNRSEES